MTFFARFLRRFWHPRRGFSPYKYSRVDGALLVDNTIATFAWSQDRRAGPIFDSAARAVERNR